jgi:DNA-binding FadR family transcriptional regulator
MLRDFDHFNAYADSALFREMGDANKAKSGHQIVSLTYYGRRMVTSNKPVYDFHLAIARASHNPHYIQIEEHIGAQIIPHAKLHVLAPDIPDDLSFLKKVQAEHEAIFTAIREQDADAARAAMRAHLQRSRDRYGAYLEAEEG